MFLTLFLGLFQHEDWPGFRGPTGLGYAASKDLPVRWDAASGEGIAWKVPLVGEGHASPVVVGGKVVVPSVRWPGFKPDPTLIPEHHVTAWSASDGKRLWDATLAPGPWRREDFRSGAGGGYASCTPASDGKSLFVLFASSVLAAFDLEGKLLWRQEIRPHTFDVTIGASPVLHGDAVIVFCAMAKAADSRLVAFSKADGGVKWETKLPKTGFGHSTPVIVDVKGRPQLIAVASGMGVKDEALQAFDPADGRRLWWCKAAGDASSPAYGAGLVYVDSGRGGQGFAVDPGGEGDVGGTHVKWTAPGLTEAIGSPIIVGEHVFRLQSPGVLRIWKAATGEESDKQRLPGVSSTWASPIADGEGRIWFASGGKSTVVKAGPKVDILSVNDLGDANHASPAASGNRLYIAGLKHLWCLGPK
jgi:outer membrane protein assembly factor BamB